jgi:hypothetical protein
MDVKEYWTRLKNEIDTFTVNTDTKIDSSADEKEYKQLHETLLIVADYGIKSQLTMNPIKIGKHFTQIEKLMKLPPFNAEGIPTIKGARTKAFIELVYLPHVQRLNEVEFSAATHAAAKFRGKDIPTQKAKAVEKAKKLQELLARYNKNQKPVPVSFLFLQPPLSSSHSSMESRPSSSSSMESHSSLSSSSTSSEDVDVSRLRL